MEPNVLSRRIEQLAALAGEEPDTEAAAGGSTGLAALRGEIAALRADLGSMRGEVGSVRTDIDGLSGRITGSVAASRTETGTLARRVADLVNRVDAVGGRVDEVKNDLPLLAREVRDGLELVPVRTGAKLDEMSGRLGDSVGTRVEAVTAEVRRTVAAALEREADAAAATQSAMSEARSSLESRMAVLEDTLEALAERLESVARDGALTTRDQLRDMASSITAIEQKLDAVAGEQVERIVARLRDVTETRLDTLSATLVDATSGASCWTS
jgi:chromosome segregation ATPase